MEIILKISKLFPQTETDSKSDAERTQSLIITGTAQTFFVSNIDQESTTIRDEEFAVFNLFVHLYDCVRSLQL